MAILKWVQSKFQVRAERKRADAGASSARHTYSQEARKEEFDGWPETLLSIGTLGPGGASERSSTGDASDGIRSSERHELSLKRFLNCPSSLEDDASSVAASANDGIKQRSFRVLLRNVFTGLAPSPSLREPAVPESRMEKMLWALLHKKIQPRSSTSSATAAAIKKYLDDRPVETAKEGEGERREAGCKWVRTDSECKGLFGCYDGESQDGLIPPKKIKGAVWLLLDPLNPAQLSLLEPHNLAPSIPHILRYGAIPDRASLTTLSFVSLATLSFVSLATPPRPSCATTSSSSCYLSSLLLQSPGAGSSPGSAPAKPVVPLPATGWTSPESPRIACCPAPAATSRRRRQPRVATTRLRTQAAEHMPSTCRRPSASSWHGTGQCGGGRRRWWLRRCNWVLGVKKSLTISMAFAVGELFPVRGKELF